MRALEQSKQVQAELREMVDQLSAEPWPIARLLRLVETDRGPRALVQIDNSRRLLALHQDCDRYRACAYRSPYMDAATLEKDQAIKRDKKK